MMEYKVTFFCDDKKLGAAKRALVGLVRDLKDEPVVNGARDDKGKMRQLTNGQSWERVAHALITSNIPVITLDQLSAAAKGAGLSSSRSTAYNLAGRLISKKVLKRAGHGQYKVVGKIDATANGAGVH